MTACTGDKVDLPDDVNAYYCTTCEGTGFNSFFTTGPLAEICTTCGGTGYLIREVPWPSEKITNQYLGDEAPSDNAQETQQSVQCPQCYEKGIINTDDVTLMQQCPTCKGNQTVDQTTAQNYYKALELFNKTMRNIDCPKSENVDNRCSSCGGSGKCPWCAGRGERIIEDLYNIGEYIKHDCKDCNGSGRCQACLGTGDRY